MLERAAQTSRDTAAGGWQEDRRVIAGCDRTRMSSLRGTSSVRNCPATSSQNGASSGRRMCGRGLVTSCSASSSASVSLCIWTKWYIESALRDGDGDESRMASDRRSTQSFRCSRANVVLAVTAAPMTTGSYHAIPDVVVMVEPFPRQRGVPGSYVSIFEARGTKLCFPI